MLRRFTAAVLGVLLVLPSFASAATTLTSRAAEAEVTEEDPAGTVEILYDSVPRYYEKYCTEESAAVLSGVLKKYTKEDALQLEGDQKVHFCDELSTALAQLKYKKAEVPQVYITTDDNIGNELIKETGYIPAYIAVTDTDGSTVSESGIIKVRGNSTALVSKKSFAFKFDSKQNLLGMGKGKKWNLLADCLDPTFMRNYVAFELGKELDIPYTSEHRFTEVWVDGVFKGCYELTEPVSEGKNRVDIDVESNNGMNEFLIQYEYSRANPGDVYFTAEDMRFRIKDPDVQSEEQRLYIKYKTTDIVKIVESLDYDEICKVIDTHSFAAYYLMNEYYKPVDVGFSSVFFYYKNGKLYAGPPWDYDLAAGNLNEKESENSRLCLDTTGLFAANYIFFKYLCQCDEFIDEVRHIYREHYDFFENIYKEDGLLYTVSSQYYDIFQRNYSDTDWDMGWQYLNLMHPPFKTYEENYEYLRGWYRDRNEWLSDYFRIFALDDLLAGDLDENGEVNIADAVILSKYLLTEKKLTQTQYSTADINSDGNVNTYDMVLMRKLVSQNK
ncbi:CotH kinase family protein [Ruminococcus sp. XPD3002]|uniref:CotH kinase family protein n=1 Tax=Ruminococcus sp. XPD3002 TaxID=1452269 RepID=UPI00091F9CA3|nr:CotH protein [Ruminococcus flavefaciens]